METLLKKLDGPETEPQQITGHEFSDVNASKKASSHLKRKLTLLVTLAITFAAFLMTACDDGGVKPCTNCPPPPPPPHRLQCYSWHVSILWSTRVHCGHPWRKF